MSNVVFENQYEPIVIGKPLFDLLLKQEKIADLLALYCFYYYTAKWQGTNQPKATSGFVQQGLNWSEERFLSAKRRLKELELIEDFKTRNPKTNKITGHYIRVNFIWTKGKTTALRKPLHGKTTAVETMCVNALSNNKLNALSNNKLNALSAPMHDGLEISDGNYIDECFQEFWSEWPEGRKENKKKAREAFTKHFKLMPPISELIEILRRHKKKPSWNEAVRYIPHPTTWLNGHRWKDDVSQDIGETHPLTDKHPEFAKQSIDLLKQAGLTNSKAGPKLLNELLSIKEYHARMLWPSDVLSNKFKNSAMNFFQHFVWYLESLHWLDGSIINVSAEGKLFQGFVDEVIDEHYGFNIRPPEQKEKPNKRRRSS